MNRKRVLITGGKGTVGSAFIKYYSDVYEFHCIGSSDLTSTSKGSVIYHKCDITNEKLLNKTFSLVEPDIVIHAAALKHVNIAEKEPTKTVNVNIVGSLNVINSSIHNSVPITIGISTDKACHPEGIYGYTKKIMEDIFLDNHSSSTKFVCVRFSNIANSNGSVIPFWLNNAKSGLSLKLTDSRMNRLMYSQKEASELIKKAIDFAKRSEKTFILAKVMKSVNMLELAKTISDEYNLNKEIEIIGLRPGEKLNEILISQKELQYAFLSEDSKYVVLKNSDFGDEMLKRELSSLTAEYMNKDEINELFTI